MKITAKLVKELRDRTGAGMMDCKKALVKKDGNVEDSIIYLREKGIAKASKKASRIATEGLVFDAVSKDKKSGAILEFNSETDFVAKNDDFINYGKDLTKLILDNAASSVNELNELKIDGKSVEETTKSMISTIGENMNIRRLSYKNTEGFVTTYIHMGGKIGVIIDIDGEINDGNEIIANDVAMHIAAMAPKYFTEADIPEEDIEKEKSISRVQLLNEGKPEKIIEKILIGKIRKFAEDNCLVKQKFVKDDKLSVEKYLGDLKINSYERFKLGEGLDKKEEDFAAEVKAQINQ
ncbi:MAG: translation elongation factor Ts [Candidatus Cloacimonadota bacterium]|nr:translation elongation factor Ts [Candidatus Cloacimonadota bacterium]